MDKNVPGQAPRFDLNHETCFGKTNRGFIEGFFTEFRDSYRYTFLIQFILVSLLYFNVGKGVYWKVLFYASLAGLLGSIFENITVSYICREDMRMEQHSIFFTFFLINEMFWITCEYSIPYLNLIKMKAFARGKLASIIRIVILVLAVPFIYFRFLIGYARMKRGYLNDDDIQIYHGYAFGVMAMADIICTFSILYFVRQNNLRAISNLDNYIKHSSYTILVGVDIVSTCLSLLIIINSAMVENPSKVLQSLTVPLYCFKSSFVLILALDAFLFKYGANMSSINESSNNNSRSYGGAYKTSGSTGVATYKSYKSLDASNKSKPYSTSYAIDMNTVSKNASSNTTKNNSSSISNTTSFNKSNQSNIVPPYKAETTSPIFNKSIVKNYTNNVQTNQSHLLFDTTSNNSQQIEVNAYSKTFGYFY